MSGSNGGGFGTSAPRARTLEGWSVTVCPFPGLHCSSADELFLDGYHLAMIDQYVLSWIDLINERADAMHSTISLTLFPSLSKRRTTDSLLSYSPSFSTLPSLDGEPGSISSQSSPSFLSRLIGALAEEFDYFLHWDLPLSTIVEFNEVGQYSFLLGNCICHPTDAHHLGKATHVRDVVDVRDVIETFVPLAKRVGWITRRLTGMFSSTVGSVVMSMLPQTGASRLMNSARETVSEKMVPPSYSEVPLISGKLLIHLPRTLSNSEHSENDDSERCENG